MYHPIRRSTGQRGAAFRIADGFGESSVAADVTHVPLLVSLPGAAGLRADRGLDISVSNLVRTEVSDDRRPFLVLQLPTQQVNRMCGCRVQLTWRDQGWGNRKSRVGLKGVGDFSTEVADHVDRTDNGTFDFALCFGDQLHQGSERDQDHSLLEFYYIVGGGGGHEIRVAELRVSIFTFEGLARPALNFLFTLRAVACLTGSDAGGSAVVAIATTEAITGQSGPRITAPSSEPEEGCSLWLSLASLPKDVQCVVLGFLAIPLEYLLFDVHRARAASIDGRLLPPGIVPFRVLCDAYQPIVVDPALPVRPPRSIGPLTYRWPDPESSATQAQEEF